MNIEFCVRVAAPGEGNGDWWTIEISDGQAEFARVQATNIDIAMRMAVPYMICAAEPDPLARLIDK